MISTRDQLRRELRKLRRNITPLQRKRAARRFAVIADRAYLLRPGARIAAYHAYGHEADASHLIQRAWERGCEVYLPVITHARAARMQFFPFTPDTQLRMNAFGIPEPDSVRARSIPVRHLDVVFMPLVGFDARGWRLGSGAGFYDRCMHHLRGPRRWRRPRLVGVAYAQQHVERLVPNEWDVPMDAVITERSFTRFKPQRSGTTP
jgi:5-formyltetrahydrofolate cyclo-ligase